MTRAILIIEDIECIRESIQEILELEGYAVASFSDGEAALDYLRHAPRSPALILMDLMLPGMPGYKLMQMLRALLPDVPILVMTAGGPEMLDGLGGLNATDVIRKPIQLHSLLNTIKERAHG